MDEQAAVTKIQRDTQLGIEAAKHRRVDLARQYFDGALSLAEDLKDPRRRREELCLLSMVFDSCFVHDLALIAAEEVVDLDSELGLEDRLVGDMLNVGNAQLNLGNHGKAESIFREALARALQAKQLADAASASTNLGNVLSQTGRLREALKLYEESLQYLEQEPFDDTERNTRIMLLQVGEHEKLDTSRALANAQALYRKFWSDLAPPHQELVEGIIDQLAARSVAAQPHVSTASWKQTHFPDLVRERRPR